jgi:geranylgeranyl pyrophosphate synthase
MRAEDTLIAKLATLIETTDDEGLPLAALFAGEHEPTDDESVVALLLDRLLVEPARDLVRRPRKSFRSHLVSLGYELMHGDGPKSREDEARLERCAQAVELLHAGSLIIDDVQDQSATRRGAESIHLRYGTARAICTGNWLYFWPLRLLKEARFTPEASLLVFEIYHEALEKAHRGQALDLGVAIETRAQREVERICRAVIDLKTGAITALALGLGAIVGRAEARMLAALTAFGAAFGAALQSFDDLGNLDGRADPTKKHEDLMQRKPSWVWGFVAKSASPADYRAFKQAVRSLPDEEPLLQWMAATDFWPRAEREATEALEQALMALERALGPSLDQKALKKLHRLGEELTHAYK